MLVLWSVPIPSCAVEPQWGSSRPNLDYTLPFVDIAPEFASPARVPTPSATTPEVTPVSAPPPLQARGNQRRRMKASVAKLLAGSEDVPLSDRELALQSEVLRLTRLTKAILDCTVDKCYLCASCIAVLTQAIPAPEKPIPDIPEDDPIRVFRTAAPLPGVPGELPLAEARPSIIGHQRTGRYHYRTRMAAQKRGMPVEDYVRLRGHNEHALR